MNEKPGPCDCEFTPYPEGDEEYDEVSCHYLRSCVYCGDQWWGLHCPHDGYQNPCPKCGRRPEPVPETSGRCANPEWYTLVVCVVFIVALCICIGLRFGR